MYERFTDRARRVMQLADQEARHLNHEYIGTEHMLLALVNEGSGIAANVLKNLDISLDKIRREVGRIVQHGPGGEQVVMGRLPYTPRAKKVIDYSVEEARNLNHNYVGTEHLLLGLLREGEGVAAQVLWNLGLKLEGVRAEVLNLLGHNLPEDPALEVIKVPKKLREAETYPVSDFEEASALPVEQPTTDQLAVLDQLRQRLNEAREASVIVGDLDAAARFRDQAEALARLLAWYRQHREGE